LIDLQCPEWEKNEGELMGEFVKKKTKAVPHNAISQDQHNQASRQKRVIRKILKEAASCLTGNSIATESTYLISMLY